MKGNIISVLFIICCCWAGNLQAQGNPMFRKNETRAVIVGISDYQNISDLDFAHRDAAALAAYLQSSAGGAVPADNIRLLLNEEATQMQFAMALDWLLEESEAGDRAYIYFSGHGDVEKKTARQRGFLLTHDAPNTTYMAGGAFPILFLQDIVSVLSSEKEVEVILMADACRAGNLAGNAIGGNHVTAEKLAEAYANEIKILSCQKDELSQEGQQWGGGRGVFSYHLIEGMTGLADESGDAEVSLREIRNYLENLVGQETAGNQYPLVVGDLSHRLSRVDNESLAKLKAAKAEDLMEGTVVMKTRGLAEIDPDTSIWQQYLAFNKALGEKHLLYPEAGAAYTIFKKIADEAIIKPYRKEMERGLAVALHDEAQQAINDYLTASPEELRMRWSYDKRYNYYPEYLQLAGDLLGPDHFMYSDLRTRQLYFEGLQLRLRGEREKDASLFEKALKKQETVISMDSSAAYAYNEKGLLLRRMDQNTVAIRFFEMANEYSPTWVVPMANQLITYVELGQLDLARSIAELAIAADSTYALTYHNLGYSFEVAEAWDEAIAAYSKAIHFNPDYTDTYYNLGLVYYFKGELDKTEKYFLQYAEKLREPQAAIWSDLGFIADSAGKPTVAEQYLRKALGVDPEYANAYYNLGELYLKQGQLEQAKKEIKNYLQQQPKSADGYYVLAQVLAKGGQVKQAIEQLEMAVSYGFNDVEQLAKDEFFQPLRSEASYKMLLEKIRK